MESNQLDLSKASGSESTLFSKENLYNYLKAMPTMFLLGQYTTFFIGQIGYLLFRANTLPSF